MIFFLFSYVHVRTAILLLLLLLLKMRVMRMMTTSRTTSRTTTTTMLVMRCFMRIRLAFFFPRLYPDSCPSLTPRRRLLFGSKLHENVGDGEIGDDDVDVLTVR